MGKHEAPGQGERDAHQIRRATRTASAATSTRTRSGKPSVVGHAAKGAAGGAATGAALGTVVGGPVGTAVGAGAGALVGGAGGAAGGAASKRAARLSGRSPGQRALVAEFAACVLILGLSPLTDKHKADTPAQWMKRATGISALFIILGLVSGAGPRAARAAAGLGGLVLVTLAVSDRDVLTVVASRFKSAGYAGPAGPVGAGAEADFGPAPGVPDAGVPPTFEGPLPGPGRGLPPWRGPF